MSTALSTTSSHRCGRFGSGGRAAFPEVSKTCAGVSFNALWTRALAFDTHSARRAFASSGDWNVFAERKFRLTKPTMRSTIPLELGVRGVQATGFTL